MVFHKIMAGLIGVCLIIFNVVNTRYQPFVLLAVYVLTVFLSWLEMMIKRQYFSVDFARRKEYSRRGGKASFVLMLKNRYFMPVNHVNIELRAESGEEEYVGEFKAVCEEFSSTQASLLIPAQHCAIWDVELQKSYIYDMFQIFKRRISGKSLMELVVLPSTEDFTEKEINWLEQIFNEEEYRTDKRGQDTSSVFDIREYRAGDKLNQIHWKLTGKMEQVMVKEWGQPMEREVVIFLDMAADGTREEQLEARDKALGKFYGLGQWLCKRQIAYRTGVYHKIKDKIFYYDVESLAQLRQTTEAVLRLPFCENNDRLQKEAKVICDSRQAEVLYVSQEEIRGMKDE